VLDRLLESLGQRLPVEVLEEVVRDAGRRMALERPLPRGGVRERAVAAAAVLDELGGLAEVREVDGLLLISAWTCPLAAVVPGHPELCRLLEALLADIVGAPVRERCDRREPPRCSFEVVGAGLVGRRRQRPPRQ
jgi:predicted ArsR family transcriptional regulator